LDELSDRVRSDSVELRKTFFAVVQWRGLFREA
jgi:hypothetical protein